MKTKQMNGSFDDMTHEEEREFLIEVLSSMSMNEILAVGDVYSILREEFNNWILEQWAKCKDRCTHCGGNKNEDGDCFNCDEIEDDQ